MESYKIAANGGVKSMQKYWLLRELEELAAEQKGSANRGLEHLDVLGLIAIFDINLGFLNPIEFFDAYDPGLRNVKDFFNLWNSKRKSKGYTTDVSLLKLMETQIMLNNYVAENCLIISLN